MATENKVNHSEKADEKVQAPQNEASGFETESQPLDPVTILQARLDSSRLKPESVRLLQRKVGNREIDRLLMRPVPSQSSKSIQRLLLYPYTLEGDRLEGPPQKITLADASYEKLIEYKKIWNEKQRGAPHRQWTFEEGDVEELDRLIAEQEASNKVGTVSCSEGEVKVARPTQVMKFGAITSCMAISLVLSDNTVISAHNGLFAQIPGGGIPQINQIAATYSNKAQPAQVIAVGDGQLWGTHIEAQGTPLVSEDTEAFKAYLNDQLHAPAEFNQNAEGSASISAGDHRRYVRE